MNQGGFGPFNIIILLCSIMMWSNVNTILLSPAILPNLLKCDLHLDSIQKAVVTSMLYIGYFFGNIVFGRLSDFYGRKKCIICATAGVSFVSLLFSFAPNYTWVLVFEFLSGFLTSGMVLCSSLCIEYMPVNKRSYTLLIAIGVPLSSGLYSLVTWLFLNDKDNWRMTLRFAHSLALGLSVPIYYFFVPESPRYLLATGKSLKALQIFKKLWSRNNVHPLIGRLQSCRERNANKEDNKQILWKLYVKSTILVLFLWFVNGLMYYGSMFLVTNISGSCLVNSSSSVANSTCHPISSSELSNLFITALGDLPGVLISIPIIDKFGRRKTLVALSLIMAVSFTPLFFCEIVSYSWLTIGVIRGTANVLDAVLEVYAPELYPTTFRTTAVSIVKSGERFGVILSPYISQVLIKSNHYLSLAIYVSLAVVGSICSLVLPVETTGAEMCDVVTVQDFEKDIDDA